MNYYVLNPDTNEEELVGQVVAGDGDSWYWKWEVDPRSVREDEKIVDENGKVFCLSDFVSRS